MAKTYEQDDGYPWGYIAEDLGDWQVLPKTPLLDAGLGPPPFDVELPGGRIRRVIHQPGNGPNDKEQAP